MSALWFILWWWRQILSEWGCGKRRFFKWVRATPKNSGIELSTAPVKRRDHKKKPEIYFTCSHYVSVVDSATCTCAQCTVRTYPEASTAVEFWTALSFITFSNQRWTSYPTTLHTIIPTDLSECVVKILRCQTASSPLITKNGGWQNIWLDSGELQSELRFAFVFQLQIWSDCSINAASEGRPQHCSETDGDLFRYVLAVESTVEFVQVCFQH